MKKKETIFVISFLVLLAIVLGGYLIYKNIVLNNDKDITEYIPQEEISDEQMRQTIITLYYKNKETGEIMPEARKVDVNVLAKSPYEYLVNCLMELPKSEKLINIIPENAKLNKVELKEGILYVDFSKEFLDNGSNGKENEEKLINSIVKTVTELNEVEGVKIIIEGEENREFLDKGVHFKEIFYRED